MKPEDFVRSLRTSVVDENVNLYADILCSTDRDNVKDRYWKTVLALFDSLEDESKDVLLSIMRQVTVDSVSNVLGILDGSSFHSAGNEELVLIDSSRNKLNGNLQDLFLEGEEA